MKLTTDNGTILNSEELAAPTLNSQIKRLNLNLVAFVATTPDGPREYVVVDRSAVIYSSQSLEAVSVWLDLYEFTERTDAPAPVATGEK